jgi:hypothetical protein
MFLTKEDDEGRIQAISALSTYDSNDKELQNILRVAFTLGNLAHNNQDAYDMIEATGLSLPDPNTLKTDGEKEADKSKQTIGEIRAMLFEK